MKILLSTKHTLIGSIVNSEALIQNTNSNLIINGVDFISSPFGGVLPNRAAVSCNRKTSFL